MNVLKVVIHAPPPDALGRARSNARNLIAAVPDCQCEIVVNAAAVAHALDHPEEDDSTLLRLCENTLKRTCRPAPDGLNVIGAAILHLATRQADGWIYIRA